MRDSTTRLLEEAYEKVMEAELFSESLTPEQQQEIISRFQKGERANSIARDFATSVLAILRSLPKKNISIKPRGRPSLAFTPEQQQEIINRYKSGETIEKIAASFGVSPPPIIKFLRNSKVQMRRFKINWSKEQLKDMVELYKKGLSPREIAKKYNVSATAIHRALSVDANITLKGHRNPEIHVDYTPEIDPEEMDKRKYGYEYATGVQGYNPDTIYMQSPSGEVEEVNSIDTDTIDTLELQGWKRINPTRTSQDRTDIDI